MLWHPSNGEAYKYFDQISLNFATEAINVSLGLCANDFMPYLVIQPHSN